MLGLVSEILFHDGNNALIAGGLLVLRHGFEHHVIRPPIVLLPGILFIGRP